MSSPYRRHEKVVERSVDLDPHPEVWGSILAAMAVSFLTGLSLCATAEESLGLAMGTLLLAGTLVMAPIAALATARRPIRLEIAGGSIRLLYPGAKWRVIDQKDLFIHAVGRSQVALDRERQLVVYFDELRREARTRALAVISELAGYDVLAPEAEVARMAFRGGSGLRFRATFDVRFLRGVVFVCLLGFGTFAYLTDQGWWAFAIMGTAGLALAVLESVAASTVAIESGVLTIRGFAGLTYRLPLDELRVSPTTTLEGLLLNDEVEIYRILFSKRDWQTLVALLSRALGYDVTEPATEAARLAKLIRRTS